MYPSKKAAGKNSAAFYTHSINAEKLIISLKDEFLYIRYNFIFIIETVNSINIFYFFFFTIIPMPANAAIARTIHSPARVLSPVSGAPGR